MQNVALDGGSAVRVVVTTREDGNLALHVGDDPAVVRANRHRLAERLGVERVQFMHQVHGTDVAIVDTAHPDDVRDVDALVTVTPGVAVAVLVADCVPVVIAGERAIAVVHAGRRGVADGVVVAAVASLRSLGASSLEASLGPSICARCYEVPDAMRADVAGRVPSAFATTSQGTPSLDLPAGVRAQLASESVGVAPVQASCTREDLTYYSHRRDGVTGRFAVVAMLAE